MRRYFYYVVFALAALLFWLLVLMFVFDFFPIPIAEPACRFEAGGCAPLTVWEELFSVVVAYGALPVTVLVFIFYRRWVRRRLDMEVD